MNKQDLYLLFLIIGSIIGASVLYYTPWVDLGFWNKVWPISAFVLLGLELIRRIVR